MKSKTGLFILMGLVALLVIVTLFPARKMPQMERFEAAAIVCPTEAKR